jgi:Bacterial PH domain
VEDLPDVLLLAELGRSERLLWTGKPRGGICFRGQDLLAVPFSLMWCGFAIFWEAGVVMSGAPFFFRLLGIPFVAIGLYLVLGRFFVDAFVRSKTFYGVTNERVLIVTAVFDRRTRSINLRTLGDVSVSQHGDKSGTITFGSPQPFGQIFGPGFSKNRYSPPVFDRVENVKNVYELIVSTQKKLLSA